jgi:hypothetical protein
MWTFTYYNVYLAYIKMLKTSYIYERRERRYETFVLLSCIHISDWRCEEWHKWTMFQHGRTDVPHARLHHACMHACLGSNIQYVRVTYISRRSAYDT